MYGAGEPWLTGAIANLNDDNDDVVVGRGGSGTSQMGANGGKFQLGGPGATICS